MSLFDNIRDRRPKPCNTQTSITSWRAAKEAIKAQKQKINIQPVPLFKTFGQNQQSKKISDTSDINAGAFLYKRRGEALKDYNSPTKNYIASQAQAFSPIKRKKSQHISIPNKAKLVKKFSYNLNNQPFKSKQKPRFQKYKSESQDKKLIKPKKNLNSIKIGNKQVIILKLLGQGKFGKVFLVIQKTVGFLMAMKVIQKQKIDTSKKLQQLINQLKIQTFLNHPNIVKCYGFFQDKNRVYSLIQLGSDGQLYSFMQKSLMSEESASFIVRSLLEAMSYLHQNKIVHRDLKPQNIVVTHGCVKICDFGWAVRMKSQLRSTYCGTPLYFSPQMLTGIQYDEKVDIWAIGVMTFQMLAGASPFGITKQQHLHKIITHEVIFEETKQIKYSKCFKNFVKSILRKNPDERLSCKQLLKQKFITQYDQLDTCQHLCKNKLKNKIKTV